MKGKNLKKILTATIKFNYILNFKKGMKRTSENPLEIKSRFFNINLKRIRFSLYSFLNDYNANDT
jgi:hypothetical protein